MTLKPCSPAGSLANRRLLAWDDGPVAFRVRGIMSPLIALTLSYHAGPTSICENTAQVLIFRRDDAKQVLELLARLNKSDGQPKLHTLNGAAQPVSPYGWDQLVLDPSITSLLKDDLGSFFEREPWFRKMHLPFRRGYLLHEMISGRRLNLRWCRWIRASSCLRHSYRFRLG